MLYVLREHRLCAVFSVFFETVDQCAANSIKSARYVLPYVRRFYDRFLKRKEVQVFQGGRLHDDAYMCSAFDLRGLGQGVPRTYVALSCFFVCVCRVRSNSLRLLLLFSLFRFVFLFFAGRDSPQVRYFFFSFFFFIFFIHHRIIGIRVAPIFIM